MVAGITEKEQKIIENILKDYSKEYSFYYYGSRVKGTFEKSSDLDILIKGEKEMPLAVLEELKEKFDESLLPYIVNFSDFNKIDEVFYNRIKESLAPYIWKECTLNEACIQITDGVHNTVKDDANGKYYLLSCKNIKDGSVYIGSQERKIDEETFLQLRKRTATQKNDVLLSSVGTIGEVGIIKDENPKYEFQRSVAILKANPKVLNYRYLYYILKNMYNFLNSYADGAVQKCLFLKDIRRITTLLPPLLEQDAIAEVLGSLDDKIELNRQMNKTLEDIAQAIFKSWFVDFEPVKAKAEGRTIEGLSQEILDLFSDSFNPSKLGGIPKGWDIGYIKDLCIKVQNGGTPRKNIEEYWNDANIPWLTSGEVRQSIIINTEKYISERGLENSSAKWITKNATSVALYGATAGQVTFLATDLTTNQAVCSLIPKMYARYYNYFSLFLNISTLENQARGSAQQNISKNIVSDFKIIIPEDKILKIFDEIIEPLFNKRIKNLTEIQTLSNLRDTLLPKLISGELRIPDAKKLVEGVV